jgi:hypothetical protein
MPFTEPIKYDDPVETVKKIARLATLLLQLRTEYEQRSRPDTLIQIRERAAELYELSIQLPLPPEKEIAPASPPTEA